MHTSYFTLQAPIHNSFRRTVWNTVSGSPWSSITTAETFGFNRLQRKSVFMNLCQENWASFTATVWRFGTGWQRISCWSNFITLGSSSALQLLPSLHLWSVNDTVSWWGYKNHLTSYHEHWCHCETCSSAYGVFTLLRFHTYKIHCKSSFLYFKCKSWTLFS